MERERFKKIIVKFSVVFEFYLGVVKYRVGIWELYEVGGEDGVWVELWEMKRNFLFGKEEWEEVLGR